MRERTESPARAPMLPDWLAYLYKPILPYLKKINIHREGPRKYNPEDILLPEGYTAEVVASGFNAPVQSFFDDQGRLYVVESGHKIEAAPRILRVDLQTGEWETIFTLPEERWIKSGAVTGACWLDGQLYIMNTDSLLRINSDGDIQEILTGLPGVGDHQANHPLVGPDGKIYFGVGVATNCGVVGADNFAYEWLPRFPDFCDIPAQDITLVGRNYSYQNVLGDVRETVQTGAYVPFGTQTSPGQVIPGRVKCTGSILRCNPDGSDLEVVAWGLRNPYGLAFDNQGQLFATEHGMDERGRRYVIGDPDDFYQIEHGVWYGWPDFASGIRLDDPYWGEGGHGREPVLADFPDPNPPRPFASFHTHDAANGFDFCRSPEFGFSGDAFVACFGDIAPLTTLTKATTPAGFKVVRVDRKSRQIEDFAVNRIQGPASKLPHAGFERPSHCVFGPDGSLYVTDFGIIHLALEKGGIRMQMGTGAVWRIRRTGGPQGQEPQKPVTIPLYLIQGAAVLIGIMGVFASVAWFFGKLLKRIKRSK